jgi:hypothetical protein
VGADGPACVCRKANYRAGVLLISFAIEQECGLQLAGLLLTPFPRRTPIGLTRDEFRAVGKVRTRLAVYRQLGALPEGGVSWGWPDGPSPTPVACQSEEWLKAKMADCCCFCACRARSPDAGRTDES